MLLAYLEVHTESIKYFFESASDGRGRPMESEI